MTTESIHKAAPKIMQSSEHSQSALYPRFNEVPPKCPGMHDDFSRRYSTLSSAHCWNPLKYQSRRLYWSFQWSGRRFQREIVDGVVARGWTGWQQNWEGDCETGRKSKGKLWNRVKIIHDSKTFKALGHERKLIFIQHLPFSLATPCINSIFFSFFLVKIISKHSSLRAH